MTNRLKPQRSRMSTGVLVVTPDTRGNKFNGKWLLNTVTPRHSISFICSKNHPEQLSKEGELFKILEGCCVPYHKDSSTQPLPIGPSSINPVLGIDHAQCLKMCAGISGCTQKKKYYHSKEKLFRC